MPKFAQCMFKTEYLVFFFFFYPDLTLTDGRFYQWQLDDGNTWMDLEHDHVIEAQYSLPHTKGMKIYNTPYG